eukprot:7388886-Prymnesium_polylepis.1
MIASSASSAAVLRARFVPCATPSRRVLRRSTAMLVRSTASPAQVVPPRVVVLEAALQQEELTDERNGDDQHEDEEELQALHARARAAQRTASHAAGTRRLVPQRCPAYCNGRWPMLSPKA